MGRNWDEKEDNILKELVAIHGKQWVLIAPHLPKRTPSQIAARWEKCLDPNITKGPFTQEEDELITEYVRQNGPRSWPRITTILPHRSSKQCRERWFNHLDPSVSKVPWTPEEDKIIYEQHQKLGGKWSMISKLLPGRTDNAVKNRYNSSIKKRIQLSEDGTEYLTPDSSRRTYKHHQKERPPPLLAPIPPQTQQESKPAPVPPPPIQIPNREDNVVVQPTSVSPSIPFTPAFSLPTPSFQGPDSSLFSPTSPIPGFQVTPGAFGGLNSPNTPFLFSPFTPGMSPNTFK